MATATQSERATEPRHWPTIESVEENLREARRVVDIARHVAGDAVAETELHIRRHPLHAVGAAVVVGAVIGGLLGFGAGWLARTRR